jgi:hypothetical protein
VDGRVNDTAASNTPLARKLNLRDGMRVWFLDMPEDAQDEIDEYALELTFVADPAEGIDAAHVFVTEPDELARLVTSLRDQIAPDGQVWVSWHTLASDITEDTIRQIALPLGYVDTKACAVDKVWSGLKLVIRKEFR